MKDNIHALLVNAIDRLREESVISETDKVTIQVTRTRDRSHGDFTSNIAMVLCKLANKPPRELAQNIVNAIPDNETIEQVEIAGPGFINFYLHHDSTSSIIDTIISQGTHFGENSVGNGIKVQIEFVSANPTGPLHVGHGRGAAYGATLANLMQAIGYDVHCEYYVNDAGRQMDILATSIWLRYLQHHEIDIPFPTNAYKGEYINDIARQLAIVVSDAFVHDAASVLWDIPPDETDGGDKEKHIDALIQRAKKLLGENSYRTVLDTGLDNILGDIRDDLGEFGVHFETWYSERTLGERGLINKAVEKLKDSGFVYEKDGALWFRSSDLGDEKDRVVIRDNGQGTYFASDIAYHMDKFERGYDRVINIWGADHHGYVPRVCAAINAMGENANKLQVLLVQFANLYRGGERVQMSTRSGSFVTIRELREEVGNDAARFFYVMRKCEQHLDFDLDLAKSQSNENPVYYIQYAHARICSVFRQMSDKNMEHDIDAGSTQLSLLNEDHETQLITLLSRYPEIIESSAQNAEPHTLAQFLRDLARALHAYYNAFQFLVDDEDLRNARLNLILATRHVLFNGLKLLGVSSPESM